jgi:hypothetical protein
VGVVIADPAVGRAGGSLVATVWGGGGSGRVNDRVGFGGATVSVGVSGSAGARVGTEIVAVRVGSAMTDRVDVPDGRLGAPLPPHAMSSDPVTARAAAGSTSRNEPTTPALLSIDTRLCRLLVRARPLLRRRPP